MSRPAILRALFTDGLCTMHVSPESAAEARAYIEGLESELELRRKSGSAVDRLHNICEGIAESADGSEWSREEWERIDAENASLRAKVEGLERDAARLDWLQALGNEMTIAEDEDQYPDGRHVCWYSGPPWTNNQRTGANLRAAIDAAIDSADAGVARKGG